jgi:hypothetical protein
VHDVHNTADGVVPNAICNNGATMTNHKYYPKTEYQRYYYTSSKLFEQSLDVYKPVLDTNANQSPSKNNLPLVVLVVGSAWLGHRSIIYTGTSWWNSSGPKAFAQQGCVTVCIRHRGSFPRLHGPLLAPLSALATVLVAVTYAFPSSVDSTYIIWRSISVLVLFWIGLALGARGAASFDDMLHDVAQALVWVQRHYDSNVLKLPNDNSTNSSFSEEKKDGSTTTSTENSQTRRPPLVFGGYSSGGHVAATLLQRPDVFSSKNLPPPHDFIDAALFISGVLAVRPPTIDNGREEYNSTWCTDLVTHVVFGKSGATRLSSPLDGIHKQPQVPHLLIGCEHEVFGLKWMDVFFCSRAFCDVLQRRNISSKFVQVQSNHWNILASTALKQTLSKELEWIMSKVFE